MAKKLPPPEACPEPDMSWRAESDLRTLHDAHKISSDKERMKHVKNHAKALSKIVEKPKTKSKPAAYKPATKKK